MKTPRHLLVPIYLSSCALLAAACGGGSSDEADAGDGGATDAGGDDAGADADADTDADADSDGDTDTGNPEPWLDAADIEFTEVDPPLEGDFIYFGNWGGYADSLEMVSPDGAARGIRFNVHRLWSFGVAHDGETVAFSSLDPYQEEHFGLTLGDAVQLSWLWQPGADPEQITTGAINDECHRFAPGDALLYICRRDNFWQEDTGQGLEFGNDPYRVMVHDLATHEETWLSELVEGRNDIGPAVRADGSLLFWRQELVGSSFEQSMWSMAADGSGAAHVLDDATNPVTDAAGERVLYRQSWTALVLADAADPAAGAAIVDGAGQRFSDYDFSPDGQRVAYLLGREDDSCSDLWVAAHDGSGASLIVDCVEEGLFTTGLQWVAGP